MNKHFIHAGSSGIFLLLNHQGGKENLYGKPLSSFVQAKTKASMGPTQLRAPPHHATWSKITISTP
jgi:hypothetical protein